MIMRVYYILFVPFLLFYYNSFSQWEKVKNIPPPFDNSYWLEMYFLPNKPNYGWVCGYDGKVLRTTDMGKTWSGTIIRGAYQLEHIHFVDEKVGFTSGIGANGFGKIYKTIDGGVNWFDITPSRAEDLWGHWFVDKDYGIVIGGGCVTPQKFFLTTNGGNSWDYVTEINYFPNSGLTDVILYSRNGIGYATSSGFIWKTTDGGKSWQIFSRTGENDWQEDLWISGNTIIVPYSLDCGGSGGSGGVRSTRDFGKTWKQFSTGTSMFGAFLFDSLRGWVCGWDRAVYYTSNAGQNWSLLNCGIDPGVSLDDFWFINDTLGWVVGLGIFKYVGIKKVVSQIKVFPDTTACEGDTIILSALNDAKFYHWSNNNTTKEIRITKSGRYELTSWNTDCDTIVPATIDIVFYPKPKISLSLTGVAYLCEGGVVPLWYITNEKNAQWFDGRKDTILVDKPGRYVAYAINNFGCIDSAFVEFKLVPRPKIQNIGKLDICQGDSVILFIEGNFSKVEWFNLNDSTPIGFGKAFVAKKTGSFYARATAVEGCDIFSDTISVIVREETNAFEIILSSKDNFLYFDSVKVRTAKCLELFIRNRTTERLVLDYIFVKGNLSFSTIPGEFPLILNPNELKSVHICYSPNKIGSEKDTIIIFDRCWDQFVFLSGIGSPQFYEAESSCDVVIFGKTIQITNKRILDGISIYPNPTSGLVNLDFKNPVELLNLKIYNSLGQELNDFIYFKNENNIILDLLGFPNGLYFLRIFDETNNKLIPVFLEK